MALRRALPGIDLLRIGACLSIAAFHATTSGAVAHLPWVRWLAGPGVLAPSLTSLFLTLSGFVLYHATVDDDGGVQRGARGFWRARAARLVPLMLATHLAIAPLCLWGESRYPAGEAVVRAALVATATQAWVPSRFDSYNVAAWTLSVLALAYLLFPLLARGAARAGDLGARSALVASWGASLTIGLVVLVVPPTAAALAPLGVDDALLHTFPPVRALEFASGVLLGRLWAERSRAGDERWPPVLRWAGAAALLVMALATVLAWPTRVVANGGAAPLWWSVLWGAARLPASVAGGAAMRRLGRASFAVYLVHMPLLAWLHVPLDRGWLGAWSGAAVAAWLVLLVPVGLLVEERFVEPVARRLGGRARPRSAPPAARAGPALPEARRRRQQSGSGGAIR